MFHGLPIIVKWKHKNHAYGSSKGEYPDTGKQKGRSKHSWQSQTSKHQNLREKKGNLKTKNQYHVLIQIKNRRNKE